MIGAVQARRAANVSDDRQCAAAVMATVDVAVVDYPPWYGLDGTRLLRKGEIMPAEKPFPARPRALKLT